MMIWLTMILYWVVILGVFGFGLRMLYRFVRAIEKIADKIEYCISPKQDN